MEDASPEQPVRLTADALVVLAGPSGAGKSTWAATWFRPGQIVSSDALRAVVGEHEHDLRASDHAFEILDEIVERRMRRGLLTVIDSLGMDRDRLDRWRSIASDHGRPTHLVLFDEDPAVCRRRNKARDAAVPAKVLTVQLQKWAAVRDGLQTGFARTHRPGPATIVARRLAERHEGRGGARLQFGLLVSSFDWPGGNEGLADRLGSIASEAEHAGFESIWVMDHFMQIPQVGREWDAMLESYSALAYLAARTSRVTLGALVSCVTHRNIAHLGKTVATLDVLSRGRARCGLGIGWFEREHTAYGYRFPPVAERYDLLEDALEFLPLLWGSGSPAYEGRRFQSPEAICYPRPIQERLPILVGGSGERRTLRLAAAHADACNLFGEPDVVAHKVDVLHRHCQNLGRDPAEIEVTQLSSILSAADATSLTARVEELRSRRQSPEEFVERSMAGSVEEHIDRFGRLADAGVDTVIVSLADAGFDGSVTDFSPVVDAFSS